MRPKFWMVLGKGEPTFRHRTKKSAQDEAERLARAYPRDEFVVLESLATVVRSDVQWELNAECDPLHENDVPF